LIFLELIYEEKEHHIDDIAKMTLPKALSLDFSSRLRLSPEFALCRHYRRRTIFGTKRKAAAEFSFILAVPTMLAATGLDLIKTNFSYSPSEWLMLAVGFSGAFIVALISVSYS